MAALQSVGSAFAPEREQVAARAVAAHLELGVVAVEHDRRVVVGRANPFFAEQQEPALQSAAAHAQGGIVAVDVDRGGVVVGDDAVGTEQENVAVESAAAEQRITQVRVQHDAGHILVGRQHNLHAAAERFRHGILLSTSRRDRWGGQTTPRDDSGQPRQLRAG